MDTMKALFPTFPLAVGLASSLALSLLEPHPLSAQTSSSHHHTKRQQDASDDMDDDASPSPTQIRTTKRKAAAENVTKPETPTTKSPGLDNPPGKTQPDAKPSSADEVAPSKSGDLATKTAPANAAVSTIDPAEVDGFDANPEPIRKLLNAALDLTRRNLAYTYGSSDPASGGMDCSGTMYYLLKQAGFTDVPRQANEQYDWVRSKSHFYAVLSKKQDNFELREMRPGDLLFWTGTYRVDRDPPVTHTMIYLGKRKSDGHRLMIGASDGRPYDGQRRNGVSVFDFKMPAAKNGDAADAVTTTSPDNAPDFSGYGPIPGMTDLSDVASRQTTSAKAPTTDQKVDDSDSSASPPPASKSKKSRSGRDKPRE